jgi:hypothetical protein
MPRALLTCSWAVLCAMQFASATLAAQIVVYPMEGPGISRGVRVENLAINTAIGSVTGLVWATIRHSPKAKGALQGAAGGALMSAGRQIAATAFNGSGFVGREISATGVSLTATTGEPKTNLSFPLGPVSVECSEDSFDWRLNVVDFIAIVGLSLSPNTRLDLRKSLSSGAAVFRDRHASFGQRGDFDIMAISEFGTVRLSRSAFEPFTGKANVMYHENVHILQDDYFQEAIALPAERQVIQHLPFGRRFLRHLDLGVAGPVLEGAMSPIPYESRPWEREAYALTANLRY